MYLVRIHQQYAQIGMNTKLPAINLHSTLPQVELQTQRGKLEMVSPRPKVHIDQRQCFADANMRTPEAFTDYCVSLAVSAGQQAIAAIASEGDALADCKHNTVASMAASKADHSRDHEFDAKAIPQQPPQISWETYPVEINYQPTDVQLQLQRGYVDSQLDWGKVDIYMLQRNFVKYDYAGKILSAVA